MKPRLKSSRDYKLSVTTIFDASSLKDWRFTWLCIGNFLGELGVINGLTFLTSYALAEGKSESMSYALLAMLNGTGMVGRVVPGIIADRFGRFNTLLSLQPWALLPFWLFGYLLASTQLALSHSLWPMGSAMVAFILWLLFAVVKFAELKTMAKIRYHVFPCFVYNSTRSPTFWLFDW